MSGGQKIGGGGVRTAQLAKKVEAFVRSIVPPYERNLRWGHHGAPTNEFADKRAAFARTAGRPPFSDRGHAFHPASGVFGGAAHGITGVRGTAAFVHAREWAGKLTKRIGIGVTHLEACR